MRYYASTMVRNENDPANFPPGYHPPAENTAVGQEPPAAGKKPKMSKGQLAVLIGGLVVLGILVIVGIIFGLGRLGGDSSPAGQGGSAAPGQAAPSDGVSLQGQATPEQLGAFLDDRYALGARKLVIDAFSVEPKGFTADGKFLAVFADPEGGSPDKSISELQIYDVASGEMVHSTPGVAQCSGITGKDTVYCTVHTFGVKDGVTTMVERALREIDVITGDTLHDIELPLIGTLNISYLGESGDNVILELNSSDGLGTLDRSAIHAISKADGEITWTYEFGEDKKETSDGCTLADAGARVACRVLSFPEGVPEVPTSVQAIDAATGTLVSDILASPGPQPVLGADGWIRPYDILSGVSLDGSDSQTDTVYGYDGTDISDQFSEQLQEFIGNVHLVPVPGVIGSKPFLTYPLASFLQDDISAFCVIDDQGDLVMRNKDSSKTPPDGPKMQRASDGETLFEGIPIGVTANGGAVLYSKVGSNNTGTLVNVQTGETIYEIEDDAEILARYHLKFGVISYAMDYEGAETLLLPGLAD